MKQMYGKVWSPLQPLTFPILKRSLLPWLVFAPMARPCAMVLRTLPRLPRHLLMSPRARPPPSARIPRTMPPPTNCAHGGSDLMWKVVGLARLDFRVGRAGGAAVLSPVTHTVSHTICHEQSAPPNDGNSAAVTHAVA